MLIYTKMVRFLLNGHFNTLNHSILVCILTNSHPVMWGYPNLGVHSKLLSLASNKSIMSETLYLNLLQTQCDTTRGAIVSYKTPQ